MPYICVWCQKITGKILIGVRSDLLCPPQRRRHRKTSSTTEIHMYRLIFDFVCTGRPYISNNTHYSGKIIKIMSWRDDIHFLCHRMTFSLPQRNQTYARLDKKKKNKRKTKRFVSFDIVVVVVIVVLKFSATQIRKYFAQEFPNWNFICGPDVANWHRTKIEQIKTRNNGTSLMETWNGEKFQRIICHQKSTLRIRESRHADATTKIQFNTMLFGCRSH